MNHPPAKAARSIRCTLLVACVLAWVGAFVATHLPPNEVPDLHTSDKVAHAIGYGGLTSLLVLALASLGWPRGARILLAMGILLAYGALDELTQPAFLRTASFYDWLADAAGTSIAVAFWETLLAVLSSARERRFQARSRINDK
jgi:VanZ family protein